jgi:hypothetical protein
VLVVADWLGDGDLTLVTTSWLLGELKLTCLLQATVCLRLDLLAAFKHSARLSCAVRVCIRLDFWCPTVGRFGLSFLVVVAAAVVVVVVVAAAEILLVGVWLLWGLLGLRPNRPLAGSTGACGTLFSGGGGGNVAELLSDELPLLSVSSDDKFWIVGLGSADDEAGCVCVGDSGGGEGRGGLFGSSGWSWFCCSMTVLLGVLAKKLGRGGAGGGDLVKMMPLPGEFCVLKNYRNVKRTLKETAKVRF